MRRANKLIALALALCLVLALAACGDSFESAMARALREMQDVESVHADMVLDVALELDVMGVSTDVPLTVSMGMDTAGSLTSGELNMDVSGLPVAITYIVEQRGDSFDLYLSTDGGATWESQTGLTAGELEGYNFDSDAGDMISFYLEFASNFGDAVEETVDGVECRRYDGSFPGAQLSGALSLSGGSSFAQLPDGETLPDAPISIWLARDDGLPRRITLDMTDAIGQYIAANLSDTGIDAITVAAVTVTVDMSDYNSAAPLSPPSV